MKRLPSNSLSSKVTSLFFRYWKSVAMSLIWVLSLSFIFSLKNNQPSEPVQYATVCITVNTVERGKTLQKGDVSDTQLPAENIPANAVTDCQQEQLFTIPLQNTIAAGDILQESAFIDPNSDTGKLYTQLSTSTMRLLYLSPADVHIFPNRLEKNQRVSFFAKTKDDKEATVLINSVEITDIIIGQDEDGNQVISQFGFLVTPQQALSFTKVIEQKGLIQMAMTSEPVNTGSTTLPTPTVTPRGAR